MEAWHDDLQSILNAHEVPPRSRQQDFPELRPVTATILWEHDGWEDIETSAEARAGSLVLVQIVDKRYQRRGIWLTKSDVHIR